VITDVEKVLRFPETRGAAIEWAARAGRAGLRTTFAQWAAARQDEKYEF